jgi:branched-chain amino acid transport system substrate-binding protein
MISSGVPRSTGRRWRVLLLALGSVATVLLASACGSSSSSSSASTSSDPILIGLPATLTGTNSAFITPVVNAMKMAVDAINQRGGIKELGGAKLKLVVGDDQGDPSRDAQLIQQMVAKKVSAFVGPISSAGLGANISLVQRSKIPSLTLAQADSLTDNNAGYIFRTVNRLSAWDAEAIEYLKVLQSSKNTPIHSVGIVGANTPPGSEVAAELKAAAIRNGWKVTEVINDPLTTKDYGPAVATLKAANVDVVLGLALSEGVPFAQAVKASGWTPKYGYLWTAGAVYLHSFKTAVQSTADGWLDVSYTAGLESGTFTPELATLAKSFESKYGVPLDGSSGAEVSMIALIADAVAKAKSRDPVKIAEALRSLSFTKASDSEYPYFSTRGGVKFDANQDNVAWQGVIFQWVDNNQVVVFPDDAATGKVTWPVVK